MELKTAIKLIEARREFNDAKKALISDLMPHFLALLISWVVVGGLMVLAGQPISSVLAGCFLGSVGFSTWSIFDGGRKIRQRDVSYCENELIMADRSLSDAEERLKTALNSTHEKAILTRIEEIRERVNEAFKNLENAKATSVWKSTLVYVRWSKYATARKNLAELEKSLESASVGSDQS
jgi:hypothetical protein